MRWPQCSLLKELGEQKIGHFRRCRWCFFWRRPFMCAVYVHQPPYTKYKKPTEEPNEESNEEPNFIVILIVKWWFGHMRAELFWFVRFLTLCLVGHQYWASTGNIVCSRCRTLCGEPPRIQITLCFSNGPTRSATRSARSTRNGSLCSQRKTVCLKKFYSEQLRNEEAI